jgi:hypothetical protein
MLNKTPSEEFNFMREKLHKIAQLLTNGTQPDLMEASFMIGCLHTICLENALLFAERNQTQA